MVLQKDYNLDARRNIFNALSALSHKLFLVFLIEFYALCVRTRVNLKYRNRIWFASCNGEKCDTKKQL